MKKFFAQLAAIMLSAIATTASAQAVMMDDSFPWRFGIQLGINAPSLTETQYSSTIGWGFGATALYDLQNFIPNSYARASLLYQRKGASFSKDEAEYQNEKVLLKDGTCYMHYLELPLRFGYAYELNDFTCILAETGPYFGMRLWSSLRADNITPSATSAAVNAPMSDYYEDLRRFDAGWGIHVGTLLDKKYQFLIGCDWGLRSPVHGYTGCNLNWTMSASVYFD